MNSQAIAEIQPKALVECALSILKEIRAQQPRVHCITNSVAEPLAANTLLAIGATPSMTADPEEIADFVKSADALSINLGTPTGPRRAARSIAIDEAIAKGIPWTLDPVMADRSNARMGEAKDVLARNPTAIRMNQGEALALSTPLSNYRGTIAVTGAVDRITTGSDTIELAAGHPLMGQVTAMGCALTTIVTAFLSIGPNCRHSAVAAAVLAYGAAGLHAARLAAGPGSFAIHFLDSLFSLDEAMLQNGLDTSR